jgi:hypothetical protein
MFSDGPSDVRATPLAWPSTLLVGTFFNSVFMVANDKAHVYTCLQWLDCPTISFQFAVSVAGSQAIQPGNENLLGCLRHIYMNVKPWLLCRSRLNVDIKSFSMSPVSL